MPENDGYTYLLTIQDGFTKFAQCIIDHWISQYGCSVALHSDQGKESKNMGSTLR